MHTATQESGLQFEEHKSVYWWTWVAERVGWLFIFVVICAAITGLLGNGLFFKVHKQLGASCEIQYHRVARYYTSTSMVIRMTPAPEEDSARLWISEDLMRDVEVSSITPEPDSVTATNGGFEYTFSLAEPAASFDIVIHYTPQMIGNLAGTAASGDDKSEIRQFVMP